MPDPEAHENSPPMTSPAREPPREPVMDFGDIKLDLLTRQIIVGERHLKLSPKEFPLLYALVSQAGTFVDRTQLCAAMESANDDTSLENQLYRLRKKLTGIGYCIVSKRGRGHRLEKTRD